MNRSPHARLRGEAASDALRELGNVAFSHAATALSSLVGRRVEVAMPSVRVAPPPFVDETVPREEPVYIISLRILGDRQGLLALFFAQADAAALVDMLEGAEPTPREHLRPAEESVLAEVANIMSGSALLAMYRFLKISLIHGTPQLRLRGANSAETAAARLGWKSESVIIVEAEFMVEEQTSRGTMVISLTDLDFFLDALAAYGG